ncbi:adenylyl cyclase-associated protein 1-like isoform X1 [Lampetra fluviatilis]
MADLNQLVERLEIVAQRLEAAFPGGTGGPSGDAINGIEEEVPPCVEAFDSILAGPVAQYLRYSRDIGGEVASHAEMVKTALHAQRSFLVTAARSQQPSEMALMQLLKPISEKVQEVQGLRERNRGSVLFNHLSAVSESIPALGWVTMAPTPSSYVKEMNDAAMFYTNRVLKEYRDSSDKRHVEWVTAFLGIWKELQAYIREYHTTGVEWKDSNPKAEEATSGALSTPPPPPPPPPPPGPPPPLLPSLARQDSATGDRSALFAEINQGEGIARALKHVSDKVKTHKNPGLRAQGSVSRGDSPQSSPHRALAARKQQQPVLELEGKKWRVEYQENAEGLLIEDTELKQVVYVFQCVNSMLQIKGKINSIIIDNCKRLGLVFENVVGIVEVINSKSVQLQVEGKVPTISINKTDGCQVFLSPQSLDCEIVSAKSSEMNILVPDHDDYREFPVPEQFKTVWNGHKLVTEASEIAG